MPVIFNVEKDYLDAAKKLVVALESNDQNEADVYLNVLNTTNHSVLFQEIGKLTRDLHDTLRSFETDLSFSELAEKEMPDATSRLNYVIQQTDEAASNTLNVVEKYIPVCDMQVKESIALENDWKKFMSKDMSADEFRSLAKRLTVYFDKNRNAYIDIKAGMSEIIIAQGFQDITGQIIKKVITLVKNVEENLVRVIKITGGSSSKGTSKQEFLDGPQIPELQSADAVNGQDEVDDILSSLGF
jgi:chemotaxis protein CheZ